MKSICQLTVLLVLLFFSACKKSKPVIFSGRLLLTKTHPIPLADRKIQLYQSGSSAIIFSSTPSTSVSKTDANGYFNLTFTPGRANFSVFSGPNSTPLFFSSVPGDSAFPQFYRRNFSDSDYNPGQPTYVGKSIDTAVIKVYLLSNLDATDTIGLNGYTVIGRVDREYTGLTAPAGSTMILDTITNMLFTDFDCNTNKFTNNLDAGRKWTTSFGYSTITSVGYPSPYQLSAVDETKKEVTFFFKK